MPTGKDDGPALVISYRSRGRVQEVLSAPQGTHIYTILEALSAGHNAHARQLIDAGQGSIRINFMGREWAVNYEVRFQGTMHKEPLHPTTPPSPERAA